jgi:hypothetical protein
MDVRPPFVTHFQAPKAVEPTQCALDDPAMPSQALARLDPAPGNARCDAPFPQRVSILPRVIRFVRMQFRWAATRPPAWTPNGGDRVNHLFQHGRFMPVRRGMAHGQRCTVAIDDQVALRPALAAVRWVRPGFLAPLGAGTLAASSEARVQSIWSALPKRSRSARWSAAHTPAACHSRSRRQHVIPLPQPISGGSHSHWMPVWRTKRMPVRTARSGTRGRPPFGFGGSGGKSGSITLHSSSETSGFAMALSYQTLRFC